MADVARKEPAGSPRVCDARADIEHRPAILMDSVAPHHVLDVNDNWLTTCNFEREQIVGNTLKLLQGPRTDTEELGRLMKAVKERTTVQVTLINYDGMQRPFRNMLTVEPVEVNGRAYFLATSVIKFLAKQLALKDMSPKARGAASPSSPSPERRSSPPPPRPLPSKPGRATQVGRGFLKVVGLEGCLPRRNEHLLGASFDDERERRSPARVTQTDKDPNRALRYAAWSGDPASVRECLRRGAKIDATDADGFSALTVAARWNRVAMIQSLAMVFGADIEHQDRLGRTPLQVAIEHENTEAAEYLRRLHARQTPEDVVAEGLPPQSARAHPAHS